MCIRDRPSRNGEEGISVSEIKDGITLYAVVHLNYSSAAIVEQFPTRANESATTGIAVTANSNLAYSKTALETTTVQTPYVEAKYGTSDDAPQVHYYRINSDAASLYYFAYENMDTAPAEGVSELGLNGRDGNSYVINSAASYDVSAVSGADAAKKVRCELTLLRKDENSTYQSRSYTPVTKADYLTGLDVQVIGSVDANGQQEKLSALTSEAVEFTLGADYSPDVLIRIPVDLVVKSGEALEGIPGTYANYEVQLKASLLDASGEVIANSTATGYIVYTNAKIYQGLVSAAK